MRLVDNITDDLLIEIRQAVMSAGQAAQPKPLTGLAQQKVMLWVVFDAVRSPVVLSGADLGRVAGRIWKQAARVSESLRVTAKDHASRRDAARAAAAADPDLKAGLAMQLATISAAEEKQCDKLRREIYEGLDIVLAAVPAQQVIDPPKPHDTTIPGQGGGDADTMADDEADLVHLLPSDCARPTRGWTRRRSQLAPSRRAMVSWCRPTPAP